MPLFLQDRSQYRSSFGDRSLGCADTEPEPHRIPLRLLMPPHPVGAAEHRRGNRDKRAACLSRPFYRAASSARADCTEKRRAPAHDLWAGKPPGRLSFGYFSLAEQRKVPRPARAKGRPRQKAALRARRLLRCARNDGTRSMPRPRHTRLMIRRRKQPLHIHRIEQIILIAELAIDTHLPLLGDDALHLGIT